jgi:hypothetical protein
MKKDKIQILSYDELICFINDYYDTSRDLVYLVVESSLDVMIYTFSDNEETKQQFMDKVKNHIQFLKTIPNEAERPLFLLEEACLMSEFSVKKLVPKRNNCE